MAASVFFMVIFPESVCASDKVSRPIFVNVFVYIYIYRFLHGVYMFQMENAFYMSFTQRVSTTMLEVSSFHSWMASLAIIRLRYYPPISIRRHLFSHGEPFHIRSYRLA